MIIQYKYQCNGNHDLAPPDAEMVSKCIDLELENVTSLEECRLKCVNANFR